jgi:protein gp37
MGDNSKIEWTDATWNPVTGCTKVSEGCRFCYIERTPPFRIQSRKFKGAHGSGEPGATTGVILHPDRLDQPLRWTRPRRVFVNSLSDLFHEAIPDEFIEEVFGVMAAAHRHVFQILTKRPARMRSWVAGHYRRVAKALATIERVGGDQVVELPQIEPLPNVWLGVSVEDQSAADLRIPKLLETPAAVRFLSCEPLLGPVDLSRYLNATVMISGGREPMSEETMQAFKEMGRAVLRRYGIRWVIVGGESGSGARPMHPDWARTLRDQCTSAGVPFFFKQWGGWWPVGRLYGDNDEELEEASEAIADAAGLEVIDGREVVELERNGIAAHGYQPGDSRTWLMARLGKKTAGRELDGRTWDEMP